MLLRRWEPFPEVRQLRDEVDRLFNQALGDVAVEERPDRAGWLPPVDFSETDEAYILRFDLPGVPRDAVTLTVEDGALTLNGERKATDLAEGERLIRQERVTGTFHRCFGLPAAADPENVSARCADGVLEVKIGKAEEAKQHKIEIAGE